MKLDSLRTLYVHELNDLHDAESQLAKVLPRMAKAASSKELRLAFEKHVDQSKEHMQRLDRAFSMLQEKPKHVGCKAMKGILDEAEEMIKAEGDPAIKDSGLISAAQRIEHYEMAAYGCARTYARVLEQKEAADLLQKTLLEERAADEALTKLGQSLTHPEQVHA